MLLNFSDSEIPSCSVSTNAVPSQIFPEYGSKRVKSSYGPFSAPARSEYHGMGSFHCAPPPPCIDCAIIFMQADLEYTDGGDAVLETGMMLHHVLFRNLQRKDPMCSNKRRERFFASGEERTPIDLTSNG